MAIKQEAGYYKDYTDNLANFNGVSLPGIGAPKFGNKTNNAIAD